MNDSSTKTGSHSTRIRRSHHTRCYQIIRRLFHIISGFAIDDGGPGFQYVDYTLAIS